MNVSIAITADELLATISAYRLKNANEAQTRYGVIDPIVFDLLGWSKDDIVVEERTSEDGKNSFIDYMCRTAQISLLIEAKRLAIDFDISNASRRVPLRGSWLNGNLGDAVRQARDYGRQCGVGFCAVTNGDAWVLFPVNRRDGVSFEDSHALVFRNAESALKADFHEFCDALQRQSVIDGSLDVLLLGSDSDQTDTRRLNQIYQQTFSSAGRTPLFRHIESEIATAFSDELLSDNPAILEKVYVTTSERTRFDERIGMTVRKRDQVLTHAPIKPLSAGGIQKASGRIESIKVNSRPSMILTLGLVGAGKTTFLHHQRLISGSKYFSDDQEGKAHWVYCDFRDFSKFQNPRDYLMRSLFQFVQSSPRLNSYELFVSKAYAQEIELLKRGPLALINKNKEAVAKAIYDHISNDIAAKEPYVEKLLSHAAKQSPVFLVVDNVDQISETEIQESIFLEALSFARRVASNLILSMRDYTYVKNRNSAVFDAFDLDAIYIDAPPVPAVLSARFRLAEQSVEGKAVDDFTAKGHRVHIDNAAEIVSLLRGSVLGTEVGRVIEVAAAGNIRLALRMTRNFLQYGYASSVERYMRFRTHTRVNFATHEAIRAIMLGNSLIYRDEVSVFFNPFDAKIGKSEAQFLRLYIITALVNLASNSSFSGIDALEIIKTLEKLGFSERSTEKALVDLVEGRAIFTHSHQPYSRDAIISPTLFAGYIVRELITTFVYLENTMYDTFIHDQKSWNSIRELVNQVYRGGNIVERLRHRKDAVKIFYDFCSTSFAPLVAMAQAHGLGQAWQVNPFERGRAVFNENLTRVMRSGQRSEASDRAEERR